MDYEALMAGPPPDMLEVEDLLNNGRPSWMRRAACRGQGTDAYFPRGSGATDDGWKAVCAACPVARPCLAFAMADVSIAGNWAGTSQRERRRMRTPKQPAA